MAEFQIGTRWVGDSRPTYFVADIASNHDGSLERARRLIRLAKAAGADGAKFQHFQAPRIVSDEGFRALGPQASHQARWRKSVFEVYQDASVPYDWTAELKRCCDEVGIDFFSAPYDFEAIDLLDSYVNVYKIGSGDITWIESLERIANKGKPVLIATGASEIGDVQRAVNAIMRINPRLCLMQCNTNYTGSTENFRHIHLNVLRTYRAMFPDVVLGLSDHTPGHATVLGAVALGARVVEKHFTDDTKREGPDHKFAMDPVAWRDMVDRTNELEDALGSGQKFVADNESETVVIQRRCLRAARDLPAGTRLAKGHLDVLRPAPRDSVFPYDLPLVLGRRLRADLKKGDSLAWNQLE